MPNARLDGINEACGIATPVPLNPAICGDPAALSVTVIEAERDPDACGENVTEILQLPPRGYRSAARICLAKVSGVYVGDGDASDGKSRCARIG